MRRRGSSVSYQKERRSCADSGGGRARAQVASWLALLRCRMLPVAHSPQQPSRSGHAARIRTLVGMRSLAAGRHHLWGCASVELACRAMARLFKYQHQGNTRTVPFRDRRSWANHGDRGPLARPPGVRGMARRRRDRSASRLEPLHRLAPHSEWTEPRRSRQGWHAYCITIQTVAASTVGGAGRPAWTTARGTAENS